MLQELHLRNFRGFSNFRIRFSERSVLVGPNNAGKSSAIAAVRAIAGMRRRAATQGPTRYEHDRTIARRAWPMAVGYGLSEENLRYDFLQHEVRIAAQFKGGARVEAVWPSIANDDLDDEEPASPYFYVLDKSKNSLTQPSRVRSTVPEIGVIPILNPIDLHENVRTRETVMRHVTGRLASRHFRNQLLLLTHEFVDDDSDRTRWDEFVEFAEPWLPDTTLDAPVARPIEGGTEIDVFFYERRRPRELAWAGDGFQVFLQILYHVYRLRGAASIVLDEPDVYLHPDLQRRMFQLVDAHDGQVIFATHSTELVAEAPASSVLWVDRERSKAITSPDEATLHELSVQIGTGFNLRLARVLRAQVVLFVEGTDMTVLRSIAKTLSLHNLVSGTRIATVALGGASNRARLQSFGWIADELLHGSVQGFVILDRDYRADEVNMEIERELRGFGLTPRIWARKELESYLLHPNAIDRLVGAEDGWGARVLTAAANDQRNYVASRMTSAWFEDRIDRRENLAAVSERVGRTVDALWQQPEVAWNRCSAKRLISAINIAAQAAGLNTVNAGKLARELHSSEIPAEMAKLLREVNEAAAEPERRARS